jgi:hypothetical protein
MSGGTFHVHGPHDHQLEHAAQHEPKGLAGQLAVITALLATVGAMFAYMGGATQANAGLYKNDAAIKKTEAANQWAFYQAKSGKQNLAELAVVLVGEDRRSRYLDEIDRYKKEKADIKAAAERLEQESKDFDRRSDEQLHQHHRARHHLADKEALDGRCHAGRRRHRHRARRAGLVPRLKEDGGQRRSSVCGHRACHLRLTAGAGRRRPR